jgi:ferredoxin-NADP reductase
MLNAAAKRGMDREVWFFYGVSRAEEQIMHEHLLALAREHPEHLHLHVCLSGLAAAELPEDPPARYHAEHVSVDLFKRLLPSSNFDYYICGPPPMMESLTRDLREWGVPDGRVHFESFGASTVKRTLRASEVSSAASSSLRIRFTKSDVEESWAPQAGSLLDFAEAHGVMIDSGCRAGSCGSCVTAIKSGEIEYMSPPGQEPDDGSCLACIAVPKSDLELDA